MDISHNDKLHKQVMEDKRDKKLHSKISTEELKKNSKTNHFLKKSMD
jgi:hypothetical protein